MKIRFWQNIVSPHQTAVFGALSRMADVEVTLIVERPTSPEGRRLGWAVDSDSGFDIVPDMRPERVDRLLRSPADVDVFTAPWGYRGVRSAFRRALAAGCRIGMMSEPGDWRGVKGWVRVHRGRLHARMYRDRLSFILAIGPLAEEWFARCGYPKEMVFPYAYTTEAAELAYGNDVGSPLSGSEHGSDTIRLCFVGQLIHRKGMDLLLAALAFRRDRPWRLDVVGEGERRAYLAQLTSFLNLESRVTFHGIKQNRDAMAILSAADVLVLPSRWDGWGAVVNEALHRGVPVICSDRCGAKILIDESLDGYVLRTGSVGELIGALDCVFARRRDDRRRIVARARRFDAETVAAYLGKVLAYNRDRSCGRPVAPWMS